MKKSSLVPDLNNPSHNFSNEWLSNIDPIALTYYSKVMLEASDPTFATRIQQGMQNNEPLIQIKNYQTELFEIDTPYNGDVDTKGIENLIFRVYAAIGFMNKFPMLYTNESNSMLRVVAPRNSSHHEVSSQSPYNDLDWHADAAYRPMFNKHNGLSPMPDFLVFGVIHKGHHDIPITYITIADIIKHLDESDIKIAMEPQFIVQSPDSFSDKVYIEEIPLLERKSDGAFCSRINLQNTTSTSDNEKNLLEKIRTITELSYLKQKVGIEPGDIVILNNKTTLHKRDRYTTAWDGKDRYMIRNYAVENLDHGIYNNDKPWAWS